MKERWERFHIEYSKSNRHRGNFSVFGPSSTLHPKSMTFKDTFSNSVTLKVWNFFLKFHDFLCLYAPWKYSLQCNPKKHLRKSNISEKYLSIAETFKISQLRYYISGVATLLRAFYPRIALQSLPSRGKCPELRGPELQTNLTRWSKMVFIFRISTFRLCITSQFDLDKLNVLFKCRPVYSTKMDPIFVLKWWRSHCTAIILISDFFGPKVKFRTFSDHFGLVRNFGPSGHPA